MSGWHRRWQAAVFRRDYCEKTIKNNRADIKIGTKVFEIQHSELSEEEIKNDWKRIKKKIFRGLLTWEI